MYIPFSDIDLQSRIWVYQANRQLTDNEAGIITETLKAALDTWEAHGKALTASGKIFENRFVVIAVDERDELPSGCSIDKSVHWLQEIGSRMTIDFFDRSLAYQDENGEVQTVPVPMIKKAILEEMILPSTVVFDNQVTTKAQWLTHWRVPAMSSWLKRYFTQQTSL